MTSDPFVQWALTGVFAALGGHSLWRLVTTRRILVAVGFLFHLGMNVAMVAMVWPWWDRLPVLPQLAFFVVAAAFFAAAAGWHAVDVLPRGPTPDSRRTGHHRGVRTLAVHAVMMLAMVWAVAAMSPALLSPGASQASSGPGHARHVDHVADHAELGASATVSGALLAALLVVGGIHFLAGLVRHLRRGGSVRDRAASDLLASTAMSFGMAAMCGLMMTG